MNEHIIILVIALIVLLYGYISKALTAVNISGPMFFTTLGLLLSPLGLNVSQLDVNADFVIVIVEIALVLVLFSDAALLELKLLSRSWKLPTRLLLIGLPLTIVFGVVVAQLLFPNEPTIYMLLLALLLTPTDAALGKAVVSDPKVPEKIRSTINVESGLNDGIVFPLVFITLVIITSNAEESNAVSSHWFRYVIEQIGFGALCGIGIGYLGAKLSVFSMNRNWMVSSYQNLIPIALAVLAYYIAENLQGNGFIAAFFSGLLVGNTSRRARKHIEDFAESEGELLVLISFFIFGLAFVPQVIHHVSVQVCIYAFLSLTGLRMLPVMISLLGAKIGGKRIDFFSMTFIAWFGPRGIASILYVLIVAHKVGDMSGFETIFATVMVTVLMSIIAHGVSAQPFANLYGKSHKK